MIPILVLKTENKVIYNKSNLNCKTFFEEFILNNVCCLNKGLTYTSFQAWIKSIFGGALAIVGSFGILTSSIAAQALIYNTEITDWPENKHKTYIHNCTL